MALLILQREHDEGTFCPLCMASMLLITGELDEQPISFFECSHCQHRMSDSPLIKCRCAMCTESKDQKTSKNNINSINTRKLSSLYFIDKLFLLSILEKTISDNYFEDEFIRWEHIKWLNHTATYNLQNIILQRLEKNEILIKRKSEKYQEDHCYYFNLHLDADFEPSLYSIYRQLQLWFYDNFKFGTPFQQAEEVKSTLYLLFFHEIIKFTQYYCKKWDIKFSNNQKFQQYCYYLLENLSLGQIYMMIKRALDYLYSKNALDPNNTDFINTNKLRKNLETYRQNILNEKKEVVPLQHPIDLPLSNISQILFIHFLKIHDTYIMQPIPQIWKNIKPRLEFFSYYCCMSCGSKDLQIEYDDHGSISMTCNTCSTQDHYFLY